ncbi:WG repeat-containing protein [Kordia algicida OT-1]|uniref:WG repeat-containing protein n=1 Tax=Kordia algicida OT-1 TaxID=391587 RepID=A9DJ06_9FLAO|nr:WG repeat-containing protein [Kordia algicida]EDP98002.1 hypothetical protein KAOT1_12332 [Kordia algicida OT-1]
MKKYLYIILIISITACATKQIASKAIVPKVKRSYSEIMVHGIDRCISYGARTKGTFGFVNDKGERLFDTTFNNCTNFFGNYANVYKDGAFGYVNRQGKTRFFPEYDKVYWYTDSIGYAAKNGKAALINRQGKLKTAMIYDDLKFSDEGYFTVKQNGKWFVIDNNGTKIFNDTLNIKATFVYDGNIIYQDTINGEIKQGLISTKGEIIVKAKYDLVGGYFSNGIMHVQNNNKTGYVNRKGEIVIPIEYGKNSFDFDGELIPVRKNKKWGFINLKNEVVIDFLYDKTGGFSEGLAMVTQKGKTGYIDRSGEIVIPIKLKSTWRGNFHEGLAVFKAENGKYGFIDTSGKVKIAPIYDSAIPFRNGLSHIQLNKKGGVINTKGELVVPADYYDVWQFQQGIARYFIKEN